MAERNMDVNINVQFMEALQRLSLDSGEPLPVLVGKISKWLTDMKSVCFTGDSDSLNGYSAYELLSGENLLVNSDFSVNQLNKSQYSGNGSYTVDKWQLYRYGVLNVVDGGVIMTSDSAHPNDGYIYQKTEKFDGMAGETVTFSISVDNVVYSGTFTVPDSGQSAESVNTPVGRWYMNKLATAMQVSCQLTLNTHVVNWVKMELGSHATRYIKPDPVLETIRCQHYFYKFGDETGQNCTYWIAETNKRIMLMFQFPNEMYTLSSVSYKKGDSVYAYSPSRGTNYTSFDDITVTADYKTHQQARLVIVVSNASSIEFTPGEIIKLNGNYSFEFNTEMR